MPEPVTTSPGFYLTPDFRHLARDLFTEYRILYTHERTRKQPMKTAFGIYVNSATVPFADLLSTGAKPFETRTRRTLHQLIGQRVYIIRTGCGAPMITGSATITGAQLVPYSARNLRARAKITGTRYDIAPCGAKWFYRLEDAEPLPAPIPVPSARENHGRAWTAWQE